MRRRLLVLIAALTLLGTPGARAQSEASMVLSALPVASVLGLSTAAGAVVALPAALSVGGAVLVVRAVEASARGTVYVLERASDGARVSVELLAGGTVAASVAVGTVVTVSVIAAGTILSAAGEVLAYIPNEIGKALLYNERLTR